MVLPDGTYASAEMDGKTMTEVSGLQTVQWSEDHDDTIVTLAIAHICIDMDACVIIFCVYTKYIHTQIYIHI